MADEHPLHAHVLHLVYCHFAGVGAGTSEVAVLWAHLDPHTLRGVERVGEA